MTQDMRRTATQTPSRAQLCCRARTCACLLRRRPNRHTPAARRDTTRPCVCVCARTDMCAATHMRVCAHTCVCARACTHMCARARARLRAGACVCVSVCPCVCVRAPCGHTCGARRRCATAPRAVCPARVAAVPQCGGACIQHRASPARMLRTQHADAANCITFGCRALHNGEGRAPQTV